MFRLQISSILLLVLNRLEPVICQSPTFWMWEPHISLTWYPSDRWSFHGDAGSLQTLSNKDESARFGATERIELQLFGTYRLFSDNRISLGFLYRMVEPFNPGSGREYRLMQQLAFVFNQLPFRIVNRIRTEQRFRSNEFLNRIRYRFSYDVPLNGNELDEGETFLKGTNEILYAFNGTASTWENRTTAGLGWLLKHRNKLEINLQYRITDIGTGIQREGFHLVTNFYISILPD